MGQRVIHLANDTSRVKLDVGPEAICVRHHEYAEPMTREGCGHVLWADFVDRWRGLVHGKTTLIVVGISRIITPANRVRVGQILMRPIEGVRRISVDRTLFVGEPWRMFWHFSCIRLPYQDLTDSFLAENRWRQAQEGRREDPFSLEKVVAGAAGHVWSHDREHFSGFTIDVQPVSSRGHEEYQEAKARSFEEEHTPAAIIGRLSALAKRLCPERAIPTRSGLFKSTSHHVVRSNLPVDGYLVGELQNIVTLTNGISNAFFQS
jgi:hypothetical protein